MLLTNCILIFYSTVLTGLNFKGKQGCKIYVLVKNWRCCHLFNDSFKKLKSPTRGGGVEQENHNNVV